MRYLIALILVILLLKSAAAQLPSGSIAPDFTTTDINGNTWELQPLLDSGKVVLLVFGTTWCSPCWAYHNSQAVQSFYAEYGLPGDQKVQALFVESDPNTDPECLYGPSDCNAVSIGNWTQSANFPIADDAALANLYAVSYFPTIYMICPNRKVFEIPQANAETLFEWSQTCPVAFGTTNAGIFYYENGTDLYEICDEVALQPRFDLINLGTDTLTSAQIELRWDNQLVDTVLWQGALGLYDEAPILFPPRTVSGAGALKTSVTYVNGKQDDALENNNRVDQFNLAKMFDSEKILLKIRTDKYGAELYWELRDEDGAVLDFGGNLAVGPDGGGKFPAGIAGGPGAYGNNVIIRDTLDLPYGGCYSIHFTDAYGDGICCDYGYGYYRLFNLDDPLNPVVFGGEFTRRDDRGLAISVAVSAVAGPAPAALRMFPNPASEEVTLSLPPAANFPVPVRITDLNGCVVQATVTVSPELRLSTKGWPSGLYFVQAGGVSGKLVVAGR